MADTSVEKNDEGRTGATRHGTLAGRVLAVAPGCLWFAARSTLRILAYATGGLCVAVVAAIIAFRYVDPPGSMLMASRQIEGQTVDQRWVPISRISPALVRAVIMSEDTQFCRHHGIDVRELTAAIDRVERIGTEDAGRGASTISMQVVKNLVLWSDRSYLRKAIELPLTLLMELVWPKRRIMEVYLNIAEWGPGVFGAEAAARHHFRKGAAGLSEREATLLAVGLPNPFIRVASRPSPQLQRVANVVERRVKAMGNRADCVLKP